MKPILIITVYRRYHELIDNLFISHEIFHIFGQRPTIIVVWAAPELGRLWIFEKLLREGLIDKVLTRPAVLQEGGPTTYLESLNIRLALNYAKREYGREAYAIVQAADITPSGLAYRIIHEHFETDSPNAVVFHWENACARSHVWCTNFFAVSMNEEVWPPVSAPDSTDTLERQWGKYLRDTRPVGILQTHNSRCKRFKHEHRSEHLPAIAFIPFHHQATCSLFITGHMVWWKRLYQFLRKAWRKLISPLTRKVKN